MVLWTVEKTSMHACKKKIYFPRSSRKSSSTSVKATELPKPRNRQVSSTHNQLAFPHTGLRFGGGRSVWRHRAIVVKWKDRTCLIAIANSHRSFLHLPSHTIAQ